MKLKNQNKYQIMKKFREFEKAVKVKCYDCVGHMKSFDCEDTECSLFQFRPWSKKISKATKTLKI